MLGFAALAKLPLSASVQAAGSLAAGALAPAALSGGAEGVATGTLSGPAISGSGALGSAPLGGVALSASLAPVKPVADATLSAAASAPATGSLASALRDATLDATAFALASAAEGSTLDGAASHTACMTSFSNSVRGDRTAPAVAVRLVMLQLVPLIAAARQGSVDAKIGACYATYESGGRSW